MNISSTTVTILAIVILVGLMIYSGFMYMPQFENPNVTIKEAPLTKNKEFQLKSGEEYKYSYLLNDTELVNITYAVANGNNCTIIYFVEREGPPDVCVDEWGVDESGSNSTFLNPTVLLFKPWMLAVDGAWRWNTSMYMLFDDTEQHIFDTDYRVMRTENYRGRMSYVVRINSSDSPPEYQWIDMEKRVALRIMGDEYEVVLVEGIPLN